MNLAAPAFRLLRHIDAERAHGIALWGLRAGLAGEAPRDRGDGLGITVFGCRMTSPICVAAGFDKDAVAIEGLVRMGFGAVEAGTVTPLPQAGNPRPRLFRLPEDGAVINRMGFNNGGIERFMRRLDTVPRSVPVGVNIGPNKTSADPIADFRILAERVAGRADWITINVSSPNTPGLRDLQSPRHLEAILEAVRATKAAAVPLLVKLAPDLADDAIPDIVEVAATRGAAGLVISNTTVARPAGLRGRSAGEAGGLSGRPLFGRSTALLARVARLAKGRLVLVGTGGIASGEDILAKLRAGASFVQLYSAFALNGPNLLPRLHRELRAALARAGHASPGEAVAADL